MVDEDIVILGLGGKDRIDPCWPFFEIDRFVLGSAKLFSANFHRRIAPCGSTGVSFCGDIGL